jgi:hypothetical protein
MPKATSLETAAAAARKQRWDDVLPSLLDVWATKRPPALATLIEAVSAHVNPPAPLAPPLDAAWTALAADKQKDHVPTLLHELVHGIKAVEIARRLNALGQFPPDPRISNHYMEMFAAPPFTAGSSRKMWVDILEQLSTNQLDPRTPKRMRDLEPGYLTIFGATVMGKSMKFQLKAHAKKIDAALARLEQATEAELEAMAAILALVPAQSAAPVVAENSDDHPYFWKRIAEAPADPSRRSEYRAWLASRNDPRAEFIAIQELKAIHGRLPPAEKEREQKLFAQHQKEWLGPIAPLADYPVFENGYLSVCSLTPKSTLTGKLAGHPLWATVREMYVGYNKQQGHAVVLHPMMKSLQKLNSVNPSLFEQLLRPDAPLRPIEQIEAWGSCSRLVDEKQDAPGLPRLKGLTLEDDNDDGLEAMLPFWRAPMVSRLEIIRFQDRGVDFGEWQHFLERAMPSSVRAVIDLEDILFRRAANGPYSLVEVVLQIDDNGNLYDIHRKTEQLKDLAKTSWQEVTIRKPANTSASTWAAVEKIFSKVKIKVI